MYQKDEQKGNFLKKVFEEVTERPDSTDHLSNVDLDELQKLGIKIKPLKEPQKI